MSDSDVSPKKEIDVGSKEILLKLNSDFMTNILGVDEISKLVSFMFFN